MNTYLEALRPKLSELDYEKLCAITNFKVHEFIAKASDLCNPERIFICSDSAEDIAYVRRQAIATGEEKAILTLPGHTVHFDGVYDQGRDRQATKYLVPKGVSLSKALNQIDRQEGLAEVKGLLRDLMTGRTMITRFLSLGPSNSIFSIHGLQCTDSWYVAHSEDLLYRHGYEVFRQSGPDMEFLRVLHSAGKLNENKTSIEHEKKRIYIDHMDNTIYSVNTQYAGNSVGFKKLAFRLAIRKANSEGWLAEHMMLMGVHGTTSRKTYFAGAFPSACGKTNFAMLVPPEGFKGWTVTTVGDDIAWIKPGKDGRFYAINPEAGYFGVAPGTSYSTNANAMDTLKANVIFTNVALTPEGDVWWEGMTKTPPAKLIDWQGKEWSPGCGRPAAHPNARFTVPASQCPSIDPDWENPAGVPISAFVFGGRMSKDMPLVYQAFNWAHGVYLAATMGSEATAAAIGQAAMRRDPMAMLPFCGYNMADYFTHWLNVGRKVANPPRIFRVNWFRKDENGKFMWPGFGENMRVLKWIVDRVHGRGFAIESPVGWMPRFEDLEWKGLDFPAERFYELMAVGRDAGTAEAHSHEELFDRFLDRLPKEFTFERELLRSRLWRSPARWELAHEE